MKKNRLPSRCRYILLIPGVLICIGSIAQQDILMNTKSALIEKYDLQVDEIGWVYFGKKPPVNQLVNEIIQDKAHFGLKAEDALKTRSGTDLTLLGNNTQLLNKSPLRIKQTHNGLEVEGADVSIHFDGSHNVELMHGKLIKNLPSDKSVSLNEKSALQSALAHVGAKKYAWEDPRVEQQIKMDTEDPEATYYPVGKLMYAKVKPDNDFSASNYKLVYRFEIKTLEPSDQLEVMIDAKTGDLIRKHSMIEHAWGTVNTLYNGQQGFTTKWRGFPNYNYVLKDTDSGDKLHTLRYDSDTEWSWRPEVWDDDNVWFGAAATTHWAVQMAWNYFITAHSRNGMDGAGGKIRIEADAPVEGNSAYYRAKTGATEFDYVVFGRVPGGVNGSMAGLDVVGHEFTHGVLHYAYGALFGLTGEPAALKESFCDIFGVMVERYVQGAADWEMGDDFGYRSRSLQAPNTVYPDESNHPPSPDTWYGDYWDSGGTSHRNNGVQNFWFFLLANGGTGTNDYGYAYDIQGIGIDDAAKIAYKSLDLYMQSSSTYEDARAAAINAATWWFGACSNQVTQTTNAWRAVGVGTPAGTCPISGNITGPTVAAYYQYGSWTMNPTGGNGVYTYQWQRSEDYGSTWWNVSTSKTYSAYAFTAASTNTHLKLRCTVSSGTQTQVFNHTVDCTDCSFGFSAFQANTNETEVKNSTGKGGNQIAKTLEENPKVLAVFPNPTSDRVSIELFAARREENLILIIDAMGNIVKRDLVNSEEHTMDAGNLLPGIYYVVVSNSAGRWVEKLIIKK